MAGEYCLLSILKAGLGLAGDNMPVRMSFMHMDADLGTVLEARLVSD